jgi:hypothetical protein
VPKNINKEAFQSVTAFYTEVELGLSLTEKNEDRKNVYYNITVKFSIIS